MIDAVLQAHRVGAGEEFAPGQVLFRAGYVELRVGILFLDDGEGLEDVSMPFFRVEAGQDPQSFPGNSLPVRGERPRQGGIVHGRGERTDPGRQVPAETGEAFPAELFRGGDDPAGLGVDLPVQTAGPDGLGYGAGADDGDAGLFSPPPADPVGGAGVGDDAVRPEIADQVPDGEEVGEGVSRPAPLDGVDFYPGFEGAPVGEGAALAGEESLVPQVLVGGDAVEGVGRQTAPPGDVDEVQDLHGLWRRIKAGAG